MTLQKNVHQGGRTIHSAAGLQLSTVYTILLVWNRIILCPHALPIPTSSRRFHTTFEVARPARYPYLYTARVPLEAYARCSSPFSPFCFGSAASLINSLKNLRKKTPRLNLSTQKKFTQVHLYIQIQRYMLCQSIYLNIYTFLTCSPVIRYETIFVVINVCVCVYLNIFLIYIPRTGSFSFLSDSPIIRLCHSAANHTTGLGIKIRPLRVRYVKSVNWRKYQKHKQHNQNNQRPM